MFDFRLKSQQKASNEFRTYRVFQMKVPESTLFIYNSRLNLCILPTYQIDIVFGRPLNKGPNY